MTASLSASSSAASCVKPANITCSNLRACSAMALAINGWESAEAQWPLGCRGAKFSYERILIESVLEDGLQDVSVNFLEPGDPPDHRHIAITLDGQAILHVLCSNHHYTVYGKLRLANGGHRKKRMINCP